MTSPVYIWGYGTTAFGELWDCSVADLAQQAVGQALESSGLSLSAIDLLIGANMLLGQLYGQEHVGAFLAESIAYSGLALSTEAACASGGVALHQAWLALQSGQYQTVLVLGIEKMTDAAPAEIIRLLMGAGSLEEHMAGATFPALYAIMMQAYCKKYKVLPEDFACVPVQAHQQALQNPQAHFQRAISTEQVTQSPLVASPLRQLNCSPVSDGAAAVILSTHKPPKSSIVQLQASVLASDTLTLSQRSNLFGLAATKKATQQVLEQASITLSDIDVVELHDCFSNAAVMAVEDMGFCSPGTGTRAFKQDTSTSSLIINPSGGLKASGHPVGATGVKQLAYTAKYLLDHQLHYGLTHNVGGTGATVAMHLVKASYA